MPALRRIIVNPHKKSRVFLYSFNTLSFPKRYCILFLYQYNEDNKREKKSRTEETKNRLREWWSGKEKRAARRMRRTDQWEHLRKGLFRYRDTARQADLQATRRWRITGHQIIISRCDCGAAWETTKQKISKLYWRYVQRRHNRIYDVSRDGKTRPLIVVPKQCPAAWAAGLSFSVYYLLKSFYSLIRSSAICTALVAAPLRTWSPQHQRLIPFSLTRSRRILPTYTISWLDVRIGIG